MTGLSTDLHHLAHHARRGGILVALDFDGTLAPLVDDPADSRPDPAAARALERLAAGPAHLALVSGRALADLAGQARPPEGTHLVGGHGAERGLWADGRLRREDLHLDPAAAARLTDLAARLAALVTGTTCRFERKPASVVLHTRTADPDDAARLTTAAADLGERAGVDVLRGKDVVELSVLDVSKGQALQTLRRNLAVDGLLYAGDDVTDERAFALLLPTDVTIKIGPGQTTARWRMAGPAELADALDHLADLIG